MSSSHLLNTAICWLVMAWTSPVVWSQSPAKDALLIGINKYEHSSFSTLSYSEEDAKAIGKVLTDNGYKVELLLGSQATKKAIIDALERCSSRGGNHGVLLVGIFGHGIEFATGAKSYFCPYNVEVSLVRDKDGNILYDTSKKRLTEPKVESLVSIDEFLGALQSTKAAHKVLIADCCRNDPNQARSRSFGSSLATDELPVDSVVLFACSKGERAFEHTDWGHGALTRCFLDAINKNSSMLKVVEEVKPAVEKLCSITPGIQAKQTPRFLATGTVDLQLKRAAPQPKQRPAELVVPFTEAQASQAQRAWADYYNIQPTMANSIGMKFQLVPPGTFEMGATTTPPGDAPSKNLQPHKVTLTRPFYVCQHETTVGNFRKFIEATHHVTSAEQNGLTSRGWDAQSKRFIERQGFRWNNAGWQQSDDHPVVNVSWEDAANFVGWLNDSEGVTAYRLLTEAEWEYCCRAGSNRTYCFGDDPKGLVEYGNVLDKTGWNAFKTDDRTSQEIQNELIQGNDGVVFTAKVGSFKPNALKLFDFHGNICEWCNDFYAEDYYERTKNARDPSGAPFGELKSARGGRFDTGAELSARILQKSWYHSNGGHDPGFPHHETNTASVNMRLQICAKWFLLVHLTLSVLLFCVGSARIGCAQEASFPAHIDQADIEQGKWTPSQLIDAGKILFTAKFTRAEGAGRPAATGRNNPRSRQASALNFARSIGPDANSCAGCHHDPVVGGSGDFVTNVFVGLGDATWSNMSLASEFSAERGSPDLFGLGIVELLAREITEDLHAIRDAAVTEAKEKKTLVTVPLISKGIRFGSISVDEDGEVDTGQVEGIDRDLVVKPFNQKGTIVSVREFTINALNLHHGMQAEERFGVEQTGSDDFDKDGVVSEFTPGDVTALTLFQTLLPMPGVCLPRDPQAKEAVDNGKVLFEKVRCNGCHVSKLELRSTVLHEPGPYNVRGTINSHAAKGLDVNLADYLQHSGLVRNENGKWIVSVFSDFKRHVIADESHPHFNNETVEQRILPTNVFLTKRLWAVGNTAPYGHRADLTTIKEAIMAHGGEAAESRSLFEQLKESEQRALVTYLKTLQILPEGSPHCIEEKEAPALPYSLSTNESSR